MGFRFRKSVKAGPFRMTFSKSGVSTSFGSKAFRVTKSARGGLRTTARIPGTGISYSSKIGGSRKRSGGSSHGPLWWLFVSWWIWPFYLAFYLLRWLAGIIIGAVRKSRGAEQTPDEEATASYAFDAVGLEYREENLLGLVEPTRSYDYPDDKFLAKYPDGRKIYQYYFNRLEGALVPEPENPHDPNAIRVELGGAHIAYVPADQCVEVLQLLQMGYIPTVTVRGGPYKCVKDGAVFERQEDFTVHVSLVRP